MVCSQLNYSHPSSTHAVTPQSFNIWLYKSLDAIYVRRGCTGQGSKDQGIIKAQWKCSGDESMLLNCPKNEKTSICDHRRDAGVYCSG